MDEELKKLLLGAAGMFARVGAKAALSAVDSVCQDAERAAKTVQRRVGQTRRRVAKTVDRIAIKDEEVEDEEE